MISLCNQNVDLEERSFGSYNQKLNEFLSDHKAKVLCELFEADPKKVFSTKFCAKIIHLNEEDTKVHLKTLVDLGIVEQIHNTHYRLNLLSLRLNSNRLGREQKKAHIMNGYQILNDLVQFKTEKNDFFSLYVQSNKKDYQDYIDEIQSITQQFLQKSAVKEKDHICTVSFTSLNYLAGLVKG